MNAQTTKLIIAIDGPAGSGKSSIGDLLARELGYVHLSTGAIYRAVGWKAHQAGIAFSDIPALMTLIQHTTIEFVPTETDDNRVLVDGTDVSDLLATNEVGLLASAIAAIPDVRQGLLALQRRLGAQGGVILDGRDIGTVVFPDADLKFFLDASAEERAKRRHLQLQQQGIAADPEQLLRDIQKRDHDDSTRDAAPLTRADDAIYIDSTSLPPEDVVRRMLKDVRKMTEKP